MRSARIDVAVYWRSIPLLLRHLSILAMPACAGVIDWAVNETAPYLTGAMGGLGTGLLQMAVQIVYLFAFGVAVIQANTVWRGRRATFDDAWEEARHKAGGIVLAAIGFQFVLYAAAYLGTLLGPVIGVTLQLVAAFFLIYTIPAAAIGGMPGSLAISASIRAVREAPFGTALLAIAFVLLWNVVPQLLLAVPFDLSVPVTLLIFAIARALILAYLAFPFAKLYDDVAFTRRW